MARDGDEDDYLPDICFPQTPPIYLGDEYEEFENEQGHTVYPVSEAPQHSEGQDPPEPPDELIDITGHSTHPLLVKEVKYVFSLPDYPNTDPEGVAYVVDLRGRPKEEIKFAVDSMQYCTAKRYPPNSSKPTFFNRAPCMRQTLRCTGIKACEYLAEELTEMHHTTVTELDWRKITDIREAHSAPNQEREARSFHRAILEAFKKERGCPSQSSACKPVLKASEVETVSGTPRYFVSCVKWRYKNGHFSRSLPASLVSQYDLLKDLFDELYDVDSIEREDCTVVRSTSSRARVCGVDHPQGQGEMKPTECGVQFTIFEPIDAEQTPYLLVISHGIHTHCPPTPSKTPQKYLSEILSVIRRINDPSLTTSGLLKHVEMRRLYDEYRGDTITDIHKSFANLDKVTALIRKDRLLQSPFGEGFKAVQYEFEIRQRSLGDLQYIQDVAFDGDELAVVCFLKKQAQILMTRPSFEVDMGFKRVSNDDINEIVVAAYVPEVGKVMTFARIYVNKKTSTVYELAFKRLFHAIQCRTESQVRWRHLHDTGFEAVVTDMDEAQLEGLGEYLSSVDSKNRPWSWQAMHVNITCQVHFQRSIDRAAGTQGRTNMSVHQRMSELASCTSKDDYFALCALLRETNSDSPRISEWVKHKERPLIAAGINVSCSKVPSHIWDKTRRNTNAVESTHWKSNSFGRRLPLLRAIKYAEIIDRLDVKRYLLKTEEGLAHSYRNTSLQSRFNENLRGERSRRRRHEEDEQGDDPGDPAQPPRQRQRLSNSPSRSSSRSASSRGRRSSTQRTVPLRQVASVNNLSSLQTQVSSELALEERRLELEDRKLQLELKREELRAKRIENTIKEAQLGIHQILQ